MNWCKTLLFIGILNLLVISCQQNKKPAAFKVESKPLKEIVESARLKGAILIFDESQNRYYSNDFDWAESGQLPASTFKIPNSLIVIETATLQGASDTIYWHGEERMFDSWAEDMTLKDAFFRSCLPCYQQLTRKMGFANMKKYTSEFEYGEMVFDSTSFDSFWVKGDSKINQFQQIEFLRKFYHSELPISKRTETIVKNMIREPLGEFQLSAKTGWSIQNEIDNGWYVGFLEAKETTYFFATNVSPGNGFDRNDFSAIRKKITMESLKALGIVN